MNPRRVVRIDFDGIGTVWAVVLIDGDARPDVDPITWREQAHAEAWAAYLDSVDQKKLEILVQHEGLLVDLTNEQLLEAERLIEAELATARRTRLD